MTIYTTRTCPTCGHAESDEKISTSPRAEELPFDDIKESWNGLFNQKRIFSYSRCKGCGLLFCPTYLDDDQLAELYGSMPINMAESDGGSIEKTQKGYVNYVNDAMTKSDEYLEIGPDIGLFAKHASQRWSFKKFWMYEPNEKVTDDIRRSLSGENVEIIHELKDLSDVKDDTIGLAVLVHVLDHLTDPLQMLMQIKNKLRSGGQLIIITHNESSALAKIFGVRWPAYCMQHPQLYSKKSMQELIAKTGLKLVGINNTKNYMQVSFLFKALWWALFAKKINSPKILDFDIGLKLGNIATIAKK